jgi:signal transduction histidine kinase
MEKDSLLSDKVQDELDRQLFHLRTLYDVSHELLGLSDVKEILKSFLLMTMGNFGAIQGFIMARDLTSKEMPYFELVGLYENDHLLLEEVADQLLTKTQPEGVEMIDDILIGPKASMRDMVCVAVFKVDEKCSGMMGLGKKLIDSEYTHDDKELLQTLVNNLVVSLKNARYSEALKNALEEVRILNSAKDKVIAHLSHELKTPIAVLGGSFEQLKRKLGSVPEEIWRSNLERAERNLRRLGDIEGKVQDIMRGKEFREKEVISGLLERCSDLLESLAAEESGENPLVEKIRNRIDELFAPLGSEPEIINLGEFVLRRIEELKLLHSRRQINASVALDQMPVIRIPADVLAKVTDGLIKNAVENTPDEGKIEISIGQKSDRATLMVRDFGVGIVPELQARIFEGFFPTQDVMLYATKKPFEFNAGGRGVDLLRAKIFSERFNFRIDMISSRCKFIPQTVDECPGRISECSFCKTAEDCYQSGGTTFQVIFPVSQTGLVS